jgi:signal transduction histidine kinase
MLLGQLTERVTQVADWFIPADVAANRESREKARIFLYSHIFGPFIGNTVPLSLCLFDKAIDYRVLVLSASITGFWIFPPLLRAFSRYYNLLSVLSVQNLIFCILWSCYFYGGLSSPTVAWILTIPLLAFMYVGHSARMRFVLIAQFTANTAVYYAICRTFVPPQMTLAAPALESLGLVSTVAASLYVTMMAIFYANALASQIELQTEVEQHLVTAAELVAATEEARRAGTAKSDFIARMSHELRAPLNAIIGYSEILLEDPDLGDDATTVADLARIRSAGHYLLKLVNRILELSRAEAGGTDISSEWVDARDLVQAVIREVAPAAAKNGDTISFLEQGKLGQIYTDTARLKQVLTNLLENAAQYTHNGAITVTASRVAAEGGDQVTISVADNGPGIEPERLPYLFNNFHTFDDDDHRSAGGAGLGLALSKKFCDLLSAKISVESALGRGAVFSVSLAAAGGALTALAGDDAEAALRDAAIEDLKKVALAMRAERADPQGSIVRAKAAAG